MKDKSETPPALADADSPPARRAHLFELFLLFSQLGLSSFGGGVSAWIHRAFVEQRGWLDESEFAAAMALGRIMPGANVVNLAVIVGERLRGAAGAVVAALGLLVGPTLAVIALAVVYGRFAEVPMVGVVLEGVAASAVGLIIAMGIATGTHAIRVAAESRPRMLHGAAAALVIIATFASVGVLRFPTALTVLCLAPLSVARAFFASSSEREDDGR